MTCNECKYWSETNTLIYGIDFKGKKNCYIAKSIDGIASNKTSKAVAFDTDEYQAILVTSPDFGCNQFESQ